MSTPTTHTAHETEHPADEAYPDSGPVEHDEVPEAYAPPVERQDVDNEGLEAAPTGTASTPSTAAGDPVEEVYAENSGVVVGEEGLSAGDDEPGRRPQVGDVYAVPGRSGYDVVLDVSRVSTMWITVDPTTPPEGGLSDKHLDGTQDAFHGDFLAERQRLVHDDFDVERQILASALLDMSVLLRGGTLI